MNITAANIYVHNTMFVFLLQIGCLVTGLVVKRCHVQVNSWKEAFNGGLVYCFRDLVHCQHGGEHDSTWTLSETFTSWSTGGRERHWGWLGFQNLKAPAQWHTSFNKLTSLNPSNPFKQFYSLIQTTIYNTQEWYCWIVGGSVFNWGLPTFCLP